MRKCRIAHVWMRRMVSLRVEMESYSAGENRASGSDQHLCYCAQRPAHAHQLPAPHEEQRHHNHVCRACRYCLSHTTGPNMVHGKRSSIVFFFFSSRRRHTRLQGDWSSDVCSSDLPPALAPGWVNIGRVQVQEGNLAAAHEVLEKALALQPNLARAHFFYARVLKQEGRDRKSVV